MSKRDIAKELYLSFKGGRKTFINKPKDENERNATDPKSVGESINELISQRDWQVGLAEGELFVKWREVVGEEISARCEPIEIKEDKLIIQCVSTAWATQLNLVKNNVLEAVQKVAPGIKTLEILGPNRPSWRKGLRTIQGAKGPRDTYG